MWAASALLPLVVTLGGGCDDVTIITETNTGGGGTGGFVFLDAGPDAHDADATAPHDALSEYVDPGCPDSGGPIYDFLCDPYNQGNGDCQLGEGCYIYVEYPTETCGQEIYGAFCYPVGPGEQGDPCSGAQDCGASYCCVVTGSGTQCVKLCPLVGNDDCPSGLVCEPIDVEGFGGCL